MSDGEPDVTGDGDESVSRLAVPEMDCPSCAGKVEKSVGGLEGVEEISPRVTSGTLAVTYDPDRTDETAIADRVERAGYEVRNREDGDDGADGSGPDEEGSSVWTSRTGIETWIGAVLLAAGLLVRFGLTGYNVRVGTVLGVEFVVTDVVFLFAVAVAGRDILRGGFYSARNLNLDIDFLMSAAILAAITASLLAPDERLYLEAATLAVLFSIAELLEDYSMDRARGSLRELMELSPDRATVLREVPAGEDGSGSDADVRYEAVTVPIDEVEVGDVVVVTPGEKIPKDGVVRDGESAVNQAPITGESVPVDKAPGGEVYAGTIAQEGYLEVEMTSASGEDTISRIVDLVEGAESARTEREQFVDRFAGYYTPFMVAVAVATATVPPLFLGLPWVTWFVNGITMLVLACPCAFVISTPVTVVSGITSAARNGVLIKGGRYLEAMGAVDAIALDKTGTLTRGELAVTDVIPLNGHDEQRVLRCARGIEERSEHPIGEAIVEYADGAAVEEVEVSAFRSLTGKGVEADLDGVQHFAGKPDLFEDLGFDLSHAHVVGAEGQLRAEIRDRCDRQGCLDLVEDTIPRLQAEGKTVVLVGRDDALEGIVAVADEVRPGASRAVERLQALGIEVVMLTGDNEGTARAIASEVGIDDYRAELLPEDKVDAVEALLEEYDGVAMVGDGVNDAPALAAATVGIAMGAAGTDTAIETADVALMGDDVSRLPYLTELARTANGVIRQNVWASLGVKALLAVGVPIGFVSVAVAVLVGDAGMTLGVTGNAMRLSRIAPDED